MSFSYDTLIENGMVITSDNGTFHVIENGAVLIHRGKIEAVIDRSIRTEPIYTQSSVDAKGGIIMPGLVNTHTHLPMSLFRGLADDLPLDTWLNDHIFPAEAAHINAESVFLSSLLSIGELLLSGVTTVCDGYFFEESVARAALMSGIRAVLGQGVIDFPAPGVPDPRQNVDHAKSFVRFHKDLTPLVVPSIFCHSPYTCSPETLTLSKDAARQNGVLFQIHAAETRREMEESLRIRGKSPIAHLDSLGILDENTLLVHSVWLTEEDITVISERGAAISHNPQSNMKLASGIAPIPEILRRGIPTGLGTDGAASSNHLDLFREMDMTAKIHKVKTLDPTVATAESVLDMATRMGARSIGLSGVTGQISAGMAADIIIIDTRKVHLSPMYHPISHLVYSVTGSDVNDVMIDGKWVVRNRSIITFDMDEVLHRVNRLAESVTAGRTP